MTRLKFKCVEMKEDRGTFNARFEAVTSGSEENKEFWKYTPGGTLEMQTIKEQAFEVDKEYYIDISLAEKK